MRVKCNYHIPDMHCSSCVMRLEGLEDSLPGIFMIQGSYHQQTLQVEFDDEVLREARLISEIRGLGYTIQEK